MEFIYKAAATAVVSAILTLIIKRFNPELSAAFTLCTIAVVAAASLSVLTLLKDFVEQARKIMAVSDIYVSAMLKCLAVSVLTKLSGDLCRDAGQSALSSTVELSGTICALTIVLPLILELMEMVGGFV